MNLNDSSSPDSDGLHPILLKSCTDEIALSLTLIFLKSSIS